MKIEKCKGDWFSQHHSESCVPQGESGNAVLGEKREKSGDQHLIQRGREKKVENKVELLDAGAVNGGGKKKNFSQK